jgi:hypothetical protein
VRHGATGVGRSSLVISWGAKPVHPRSLRIIPALLACLAGACVLGGAAALALRAPPIRTQRDAVAYVLNQRGVAYRDIALDDILSHITGYNFYPDEPRPYAVRVTLRGGHEHRGWLDCRARPIVCRLSLPSLGIEKVRIPNPADDQGWPWLDRLEAYLELAGLRVLWQP